MITKLIIMESSIGIYKILANKINEIIDHLPQEKIYCDCEIQPCSVHTEPTKEVPEKKLRKILEDKLCCHLRLLGMDEGSITMAKNQATQEISALYKRGNK